MSRLFFFSVFFLLFIIPGVSNAALTEHFEGSSLPSGWSFSDPGATGGSNVVSGSRVSVTVPAAVTADSIFNLASSDESVGIEHAVSAGDLDIAVQFDTDISQTDDLGISLIFASSSVTDMARFAVFQGAPSAFSYARAGGAGGSVGPTNIANTTYWFEGLPAWLRVTYDSGSGLWTFYGSSDGDDWRQIQQLTRSFTPDTFKIGITSTGAQPGGTVRINRVVDVDAAGSTDVREALSSYGRTTRVSFSGTDASLPGVFTDDSASGGSIATTGSAWRFTTDLDTNGSRARLQYTGTTYDEAGVLVQFKFVQTSNFGFSVFGIGRDTGGIDQYSRGPGYGWELTGNTARRTIRIDEPGTAAGFDAQYTFLTDGLDTDLGGSPGPLMWARVERVDGRIRSKLWADSGSEPDAFYYDGQDQIVDGPYLPIVTYSHNDGTTGGDVFMDLFSFEFYEITDPDAADPEVSITSPSNDTTVSGSVTIDANATDDIAVAGVTFYYDGTQIGSEVTATTSADTYSATWDTTGIADAVYTLTAVVRDTSGNYATSSGVVATVENNFSSGGSSRSNDEDDESDVEEELEEIDESVVTIQELQKRVVELQTQVVELLTKLLAQKGVVSAGSCPSLTHTLRRGAADATTNGEVSMLQRFLTGSGHYTFGEITGYYGSVTETAVQKWQSQNGVVSDGSPDTTGFGVVGPRTRAAIAAACR